tara:strand:- start:1152 stop:1688 length:537 start_codon:yes stop_codon:yes gene_type:complete
VAELGGLNKDGGISFERKRNFDKKEKKPEMFSRKPPDRSKEVDEELEKPIVEDRPLSAEELSKNKRLNAKLRKAKGIQAGGFAFNGGSIIAALFYIDSLLLDPATVDNLNAINKLIGADIDFENMIAIIQGYKAQIIGFAISSQTMIMGYKDTVQKMKERGNESFYEVFNQELEKTGI